MDFKLIEDKWQKYWEEHPEINKADDKSKKEKKYILVEFPYPSGSGLHIGHTFSFTGGDIYARFKRMKGFNVLFPMGWDAFGLPTENYAIKMKRKPQEVTKENTDMFKKQMKKLAFSFDWDREVNTTDPKYYKWTQWIFTQLFKNGLAYKKEMPINWCPSCKIGLANEEVVDSKCERCGAEVSRRNISQWVVKITEYADKLIDGLKETDFIEKVKIAQINWIGKSEGANIKFKIKELNEELEVFTTRPDTLFGATFMVISPEHKLISKILEKVDDKKKEEIKKYVSKAGSKSDLERTELNKDKTGVFSGLMAINPVNNKEIPIWISDFVLASYGTGAIMSVPAHDERDYAFAKKFGLEINQVLAPVFKINEGKDKVRDDKKTVERKTVCIFVKHWKENKYLCLDWKKFGWHSGIIGGVKDGESVIEAAKREIIEETGYFNFELERELEVEVHNHFFAGHKDENRYAVGSGLVFKLSGDKKTETKEEDTKNHDLVWIDKNKMDEFLNLPVFNYYWKVIKDDNSCFEGDGVLINSGFLNGLYKKEAVNKMNKWLEEKGIGESSASYHLRDWIFSRQHYWGEPIPMINCKKCGWVPVPDEELPIVLPEVEAYEPTDDGKSPLSQMKEWIKVKCPVCGQEAERETDTMPNWAGSDWYFLRYTDPNNDKVLAGDDLMKYWGPVDIYIGGDEHNVLHLLYSRFIYKFLWDIGVVPKDIPEPYYKRISHGVILGPDNQRMSKSRGNIIVPEKVSEEYGIDVVRMYLMFMGPFDSTMAWNEKTIIGIKRFLERWEKFVVSQMKNKTDSSEGNKVIINKLIKGVEKDLEAFRYNTAIAKMMESLNSFIAKKESLSKDDLKKLVKILSPLAPYLSEEMWSQVKDSSDVKSVHLSEWPKVEEKYLKEEETIIAVAINGKVRDQLKLKTDEIEDKEMVLKLAKESENIKKWVGNNKIVKEIYISGKMVNLVVKID